MISLLDIFLNFLKIGLFAFGGAYAAIPLIEEQMVTNTGWMTFEEFSDLVAIDELTPGPIIVNSSTFIGMKLAGLPGAITATIACMIPGILIALSLVRLYQKYRSIPVINEMIRVLRCMSVALIFSVLIRMFLAAVFPAGYVAIKDINLINEVLIVCSFILLNRYKLNPLFVMLGCGCINLLFSLIK